MGMKPHLDLGYPFPWCWLIDGHLDGFFIVCHHYGPQGAVVCVDLLVIYWPEPMEHQTPLIPAIWKTPNNDNKLNEWATNVKPFFLAGKLLHMYTSSSPWWGDTVSVFTCPFALSVLYLSCVRALTSPQQAPFHHLADFPQCDQWTSNLQVDCSENRGGKKVNVIWKNSNSFSHLFASNSLYHNAFISNSGYSNIYICIVGIVLHSGI